MKKEVWIVGLSLILGGAGTLFSFQATKSLEDEKLQVHKEEAFTASEIQEVQVDTSSADVQKLLVEVPAKKLEFVKINTSSSEVSLMDLQVSHLIASSSSGEERIQLDGIHYERRAEHEVKGHKGDQKYQIGVETSSGDVTLH